MSSKQVDDSKRFYKEITALNYGLLKRERDISARKANKAVYEDDRPNKKVTTFSSFQGILNFVDDEIATSLKKTTWKKLSQQYKVKFAKEYITDLDIDLQVKDMVMKMVETTISTLNDVVYDQYNTKVLKLNFMYAGIQL